MRRTLLVLLVMAMAATLPAPARASTQDGPVSPRVIDGEYATNAPWAAALYYSDGFYCSGTIIAPRWVLTAQHCIYDGYAKSVRVGNLHHPSGQFANVRRVVRASGADLTLLNLDRSISTTYAQLASADPPIGSINQIYGWGTVERGENAPMSDRLKVGNVRVTSHNARDYFGGRAVGSTVAPAGPGYGDSGGPQFYNGRQVGVCSTGDYVNHQYGSVAANRSWIRSVAGV
jgi:secreted trypsin-like serine protease